MCFCRLLPLMAGLKQCKFFATSARSPSKQPGALLTSGSARPSPGGRSRQRHCSMHVHRLATLQPTYVTKLWLLPSTAGPTLCSISRLKAADISS